MNDVEDIGDALLSLSLEESDDDTLSTVSDKAKTYGPKVAEIINFIVENYMGGLHFTRRRIVEESGNEFLYNNVCRAVSLLKDMELIHLVGKQGKHEILSYPTPYN